MAQEKLKAGQVQRDPSRMKRVIFCFCPLTTTHFFLCLVEVGYPFGDEILASTYIYENILDDVSWIIIIIYCYVLVNYSLSSLLLLLL